MPSVQIDDLGKEFIEFGGERRYLTSLPPKAESGFPRFNAAKTIPRSEWFDVDFEPYMVGIKDQNGRGACGGHMGATSLEVAINMSGHTKRQLSAWYVYSQCNGGVDQGCVISDVFHSLIDDGAPLDSSVEYGTYQNRRISQAAHEEAKRFRVLEGVQLGSFDEIVSQLLLGKPGGYGIMIGNRFEPDADGVIPDWDGRNSGGHALAAAGVKNIRGRWYIKTPNSWSLRWGLKGWCYVPESYFVGQRWGVDAYGIESVTQDPKDPGGPVLKG